MVGTADKGFPILETRGPRLEYAFPEWESRESRLIVSLPG